MPRLTQAITIAAAAALAMTTAAVVPAAAAQRPATSQAPTYYLSLGDSLSVGAQPNAKGATVPTDQGYADQLYHFLHRDTSNLRFVKLGCPGETTHTLNLGGICGYKGDARTSLTAAKGAQLRAALAFLRAHRGHVPLITIDVGPNDLSPCVALGVISKIVACLTPVFTAVQKNLAYTLAKLRAVVPHATIVGMTFYIPELAAWLTGAAGQQFAQASIILAEQFNQLLAGDFKQAKVAIADVFTSFDSADITDFVTVPGLGKLPKDVALICRWTWECTPKPVGPNEHANKFGYGVISGTFLATLRAIKYPV
jgi:hypothetical protein